MEIPLNIRTYEMPTSVIWIKDDIVYSTPKIRKPQEVSGENMRKSMSKFREIVGNRKVCMVVELNPIIKQAPKEERDLVAAEMATIIKAMALITSSPVNKMIVNLFFGFKPPPYPVKMFLNETDATSWIKRYV